MHKVSVQSLASLVKGWGGGGVETPLPDEPFPARMDNPALNGLMILLIIMQLHRGQ